jgi:hypothetical protein
VPGPELTIPGEFTTAVCRHPEPGSEGERSRLRIREEGQGGASVCIRPPTDTAFPGTSMERVRLGQAVLDRAGLRGTVALDLADGCDSLRGALTNTYRLREPARHSPTLWASPCGTTGG